ncbi:MAG: ABC-F type ribosomal protection protein [Clostridia bacterium]|nr:ABC-F type ribosomal protection protein [Clostridia bacterium]
MELININDVSLSFGDEEILNDISLTVRDEDKIGIIGVNGAGKTTLFRLIMGELECTSGTIIRRKNLNIGYVPQRVEYHSQRTAYEDALETFSDLIHLEERLNELNEQMIASSTIESVEAYNRTQERFVNEGGLTYRSLTRSMLLGLGLSENELDLQIEKLSGGQRTRVLIAKILLSKPDILLLDEPTNHLDIEALEWLEKYLSDYRGSILVISHDRYFLDNFVNKIFEISFTRGELYNGNYTKYAQLKEERDEFLRRDYAKKEREVQRIEAMIEQQKRWNTERSFITARHKEKMADRIRKTMVKPSEKEKSIRISFSEDRKSGNDVLRITGVSKRFGDTVLFRNAGFEIKRNDRAFILGRNGTGKTTLLRMILGEVEDFEGEIFIGTNVDIGYYAQGQENLPMNDTIIEAVYKNTDETQLGKIRNILALFLFTDDEVEKKVSSLSGGEKARVALAILMLSGCNLLLLDEPTNHLDMATREILENALLRYDGTILAVSHDRYFIRKLATKVIELDRDGTDIYPVDYDQYLFDKSKKTVDEAPVQKKKSDAGEEYRRAKEAEAEIRKRKNRFAKLEELIQNTEDKINILTKELENPEISSDYGKLMDTNSRIEALTTQLQEYYTEWEDLAELL